MSEYKMVEVGTDAKGNSLYHVREMNGGSLVSDKELSESEALALMNGGSKPKSKPTKETSVIENMTKLELEAMMRTHGIELDRRKSKSDLVKEVKTFLLPF